MTFFLLANFWSDCPQLLASQPPSLPKLGALSCSPEHDSSLHHVDWSRCNCGDALRAPNAVVNAVPVRLPVEAAFFFW